MPYDFSQFQICSDGCLHSPIFLTYGNPIVLFFSIRTVLKGCADAHEEQTIIGVVS
jgi:hypothetical protein